MTQHSFSVKDLINAGLFSLLIFIAMFIGGMVGFFPVLMPIVPFLCALCSGPVFILYSTKIHRFGMVLIMGTIIGLLFTITGHGIYVLPGTVLLALVGEYILNKGNYESLGHIRWCFSVYSMASAFALIPIYVTREAYIQKLIDQGYGQDFAEKMISVLPNWSFFPIVFLGALGGYLGATIGIRILKKHFKKLDMV